MSRNNRQGVLQDAANKVRTDDDNTSEGNLKITDKQWREFILEYYETDEHERVAKFLSQNGIADQRKTFDRRWRSSGLQDMKKWKAPKENAAILYDNWMIDEKNHKKRKVTESEWRRYILSYYQTEEENVSKFLEERNVTQRDMFDKRWKESKLKNLKEKKVEYTIAMAQYDLWFAKWKGNEKRKTTENEWRGYILSYYQERGKSVSKFLEERNITQRDMFDKRWKGSNLKNLKEQKVEYIEAKKQYDSWFTEWKGNLSSRGRINSLTKHQSKFAIYVDDDATFGPQPTLIEVGCDGDSVGSGNISDDGPLPTVVEDEGAGSSYGSDDDGCRSRTKKKPQKQLSYIEMRELLIEYYLYEDDTREAPFMKSKNLFNRRKSFHRHWVDSRMKEMKDQGEPITKALESYDKWIESQKEVQNRANKRNGSVNKAIPEDIENFMRELIKQMALCGQGIGKKALTEFFTHALKDCTNENDRTFSRSTLDRFIRNYHLECKTVKNIDPVRIAQVTPENRDAFFFG